MQRRICLGQATVGEGRGIDCFRQVAGVEGGCGAPRALEVEVIGNEVVNTTSNHVLLTSN